MSILPYDSRILSLRPLVEKMNREGKGGGYLEKIFFLLRRNKTKIIFDEGKYFLALQVL